jgi:hypothetical protein
MSHLIYPQTFNNPSPIFSKRFQKYSHHLSKRTTKRLPKTHKQPQNNKKTTNHIDRHNIYTANVWQKRSPIHPKRITNPTFGLSETIDHPMP